MQQSIYNFEMSDEDREEPLITVMKYAPAPRLLSIMLCQDSTAGKVQVVSLPGSASL